MTNKVKEALGILGIIGIFIGFLALWILSVYGII